MHANTNKHKEKSKPTPTRASSKNHFLFICYPLIARELKADSKWCVHFDTPTVPLIIANVSLTLKFHLNDVSKVLLHMDVKGVLLQKFLYRVLRREIYISA